MRSQRAQYKCNLETRGTKVPQLRLHTNFFQRLAKGGWRLCPSPVAVS
jgi:hypothetical protein